MKEIASADIQAFIDTVKRYSGYDFSDYSVKSFTRRLQKILADHRTNMNNLLKNVSEDPIFLEQTVKDITVNTTEIFRDPKLWKTVNTEILPKLKNENRINIWHAGASTGQEVYTMLILLKQHELYEKARVYASDLNSDVLMTANSGKYKYREIDEYINNFNETYDNDRKYNIYDYFKISRSRNLIKAKPFLLNKAQYKKHDLTNLTNPFAVKYNLIFCRNVLIYFNHDLQNRIFQFFLDSLFTGGALIVGKHEGIIGDIVNKFEKRGTIYIKK